MGGLTKEHARAISKKLGAVSHEKKGRPHELHQVFEAGKVIVLFGIRHSSRKDTGHGHLPSSLHLTPRETRLLADCPMSREEWIEKLKEKGLVE
jgi:hypothetical protein